MQAKLWCTTSRVKKAVVSLSLAAVTVRAIALVCRRLAGILVIDDSSSIVFGVIVPVAVFVINVVVVFKVRRAATNATANLGVQPAFSLLDQSTSSNSVVPTVMLVVTSLIYVLVYSTSKLFSV